MKKKASKVISLILAAALTVSSVSVVSYADETEISDETVIEADLDEAASDSAVEPDTEDSSGSVEDGSEETSDGSSEESGDTSGESGSDDTEGYSTVFDYTEDFSGLNQEYNQTQYINLAHSAAVYGNETTKVELQNKAVYSTIADGSISSGTVVLTADVLSDGSSSAYSGRSFRIYLENAETPTSGGVGTEAFSSTNIFYHLTDIGNTVYVVTSDSPSANSSSSGTMETLGTVETGAWYRYVITVDLDNQTSTTAMYKHSSTGAYAPDGEMELVGSVTAATVTGKTASLKQVRLVRTASAYVYFDNVSLKTNGTVSEGSSETTTEAVSGSWNKGRSYTGTTSWSIDPVLDDDGEPTAVTFTRSADNNGKLSDNDEEYPYYVTSVSSDESFNISATATINSLNADSNQTAFGIVLRSTTDTSDASYQSSTDSKLRNSPSLMLHMVSYSKTTTDGADYTGGNIRYLDKTADSASYINIFHTDSGYISVGQIYELSLTKSGEAYSFKITDTQTGTSYSGSISDVDIFGDTIYPGFFAARNVDVTYSNISYSISERSVTKLEILTPPTQTEYYVGQAFNSDGMVVSATYDDGVTEITDDYVATYDTSAVGDSVVTLVSGSATATTPITVRKKNVTAVELEWEPTINRYYEYQTFTYDGISGTFTFEDGTKEAISDENTAYTVDGSIIDTTKYWLTGDAGSKTVYVGYADTDTISSNNVSASYGITVYKYALEKIFVSIAPYKKSYAVNEAFEDDGIQVSGRYSDGTNIYMDPLSSDTYTITGFDSSTTGTKTLTITLNANPAFTTTFNYSVSELVAVLTSISHYPRTSYVNGTPISEIASTFQNDTVITTTYNDDTTYDLAADEFTVDVSEIASTKIDDVDCASVNGTYSVYLTPDDDTIQPFTVEITIWDDRDFYWKTAKFGSSSGNSSSSLTNTDEFGLAEKVYLKSTGGAGKITNSYHDGIIYYYTRVNADNNFTISADVEVDSFLMNASNLGRYGQEAFGIMARDVIPLTPSSDYSEDSSTYEGLGTSTVVQTANAKVDDNGEPVPRNSSANFYSNIVIVGGCADQSYGTISSPPTATQIARANSNRIKMYIRYGVGAWDGSDVSAAGYESIDIYNGSEFGDYMTTEEQLASGECFYPKPGDVYHLELSRINGGYYASTTILAVGSGNAEYADTVVGLSFSYAYSYDEEDPLITQNDDTIYAGFFAARYASIYVTNIDIYESSTDTEYNYANIQDDIETAALTITSSLYTTRTNYTLTVKASNTYGGTAVIKLDDEVIANGASINSKNTTFDLTLEQNRAYDLTITFTPSAYAELTSYDTITSHYKLYCLSNISVEGDTVYAAPIEGEGTADGGVYGVFTNKGTLDSPLDIDTALAVVDYGQTIVLLNGTYLRDSVISIGEGNFGFASDYKKMKAETPGKVIIDMQREAEGISLAGDYWWIEGLKILNSAPGTHAFSLAGSHNIVENCRFAEAGTTAFQISGSSSDTFKDWPANNLIIYCEAYNAVDEKGGSSDGFGCKLTVGNGNIFKNCISHNNEDDGWDLYTKTSSGAIGAVILEDCISYDCSYYLVTEDNVGAKNLTSTQVSTVYGSSISTGSVGVGDKFAYQTASASGNGYKLGGENVYTQHYIKDSYAFGNKTYGFTTNSNPALKVRNCISFNNGNANYGLYSGVTDKVYNYNVDGAISAAASKGESIATFTTETSSTNQAYSEETLTELYNAAKSTDSNRFAITTLNKNLNAMPISSETNWLVKSTSGATSYTWGKTRTGSTITGYAGYNSEGEMVTPEWFVSCNESDGIGDDGFIINHNEDGSWDLGDFLKLTDEHTYSYAESDVPDYNDTYDLYFNGSSSSGDSSSGGSSSGGSSSGGSSSGSSSSASGGSSSGSSSKSGSSGGGSSYTGVTADKAPASAADGSASSGSGSGSSGSAGSSAGAQSTPAFEDISHRAWAVDAINKLAENGIITGVTATTFCPDNYMTRGDFCVLISRALSLGESTLAAPFSDVSQSAYYSNAIAAAVNAGIASGYDDDTFKPAQYITREEMFVLIAKAYEYIGADISADEAVLDGFEDSGELSDWAVPYAAYLVSAGVVNGTDGKLNPSSPITRAETAVLLSSLYDYVSEIYEALAAAEEEAAAEAEETEESEEAEESETAEEASETEESAEAIEESADEETGEESEESADETDEAEEAEASETAETTETTETAESKEA